jgi:catechol 2,3-dioxygenase-like lactoylglutathione lyase family enzyme
LEARIAPNLHPFGVLVRRVVPDFHGQDPAASREFYTRLLGLDVVMDQGWVVTFAAPDNSAAQITVMSRDATAQVNPDVSVEVDDVDGAYAVAEQMGCDILHPLTDEPWGVRRFFVREPSGRVVNILSHR